MAAAKVWAPSKTSKLFPTYTSTHQDHQNSAIPDQTILCPTKKQPRHFHEMDGRIVSGRLWVSWVLLCPRQDEGEIFQTDQGTRHAVQRRSLLSVSWCYSCHHSPVPKWPKNLWTHRSRKRQKPRLLWEQPTSHHKKHTTTVKKSWKMEKLRRCAPSFLGIQQIQQEPGFPSGRLPTFPHQRAPAAVPGTGNLLHLDQLDLEDVVWISFLGGPRWYSSIQVRYSGWSTHLLRWLSYVKLGRTTYSNTFLRLSSGTEIGAMVLRAVRTSPQRDSTYEAQQHEKIPQQKINCSLLGWCPPCSLKLVCFMFTEKVIYAGWLIGIPLTNCENPYYH